MKNAKIPISSLLKNKITFQKKNLISDEAGGYSVIWTDFCTVWADIRSIRSLKPEKYYYGKLIMLEGFIARIRYIENIDETMQVKFKDNFFNIKKIINIDHKNEILEVLLEETF